MAEIFIISGPSGVGKDTLIKKMMPKLQNVFLSVSYTTRPPRKGEIDNVDYRFVSDSFFREEIKNGNMLEYADYCTVCYGTPKQPVEQALKEGRHVILKIERAGMESVKKVYKDAITIFIAPPSLEELRNRIILRKTDSDRAIEDRMNKAKIEMEKCGDYMEIMINDDIDTAADKLAQIINKYIEKSERGADK